MLTEIRGLCEILKINESDTRTYKLFKLMEAGGDISEHFDDVDAEEMWFLLHTEQSVSSIRQKLWQLLQFHDGDFANVTELSQYNWERLRTWMKSK